jgi:hypothetical protein
MLGNIDPGSQTETIAHIIQIVLTPVFLLSGIATLLGVFSNRLARVADRVHQLNQDNQLELQTSASELTRLHLPFCRTGLCGCARCPGSGGHVFIGTYAPLWHFEKRHD